MLIPSTQGLQKLEQVVTTSYYKIVCNSRSNLWSVDGNPLLLASVGVQKVKRAVQQEKWVRKISPVLFTHHVALWSPRFFSLVPDTRTCLMYPRMVILFVFAMLHHSILLTFPCLNNGCNSFQLAINPEIQVLCVWDCFLFLHVKTFKSSEWGII